MDISDEFHLLETPKSELTRVRVGEEILTVRTEIDQFNALANSQLPQVLEVDRPHMVIRARIFLCIGQVDGRLCIPDQSQVAERAHVARCNHLLDCLVEDNDLDTYGFWV